MVSTSSFTQTLCEYGQQETAESYKTLCTLGISAFHMSTVCCWAIGSLL